MFSLNTTYYGNTIGEWAIAFGLIVVSVIVGRGLYWLFGHWVKKLTSKSKTQLDDVIVDMVEEPIVSILIAIGMRYALNTLNMSVETAATVHGVFYFVTTVLVAWFLIRLYEAFHKEYLAKAVAHTETDFDDQILPVVRTGIRFILLGLGFVIGLNNAGYDVGAVLAGLGIGGLAFALAAQDTVANLFGGITIFVQRPFVVGDKIILDNQRLVVKEVGLRTTKLIDSYTSFEVTIPNSKFTNNKITNTSRFTGHWQAENYVLSAALSADQIRLAMQLIEQVVISTSGVKMGGMRINGIDVKGINIILFYLIEDGDERNHIVSEISLRILELFEEHELQFAFLGRLESALQGMELGVLG